jgi:predicted  nucleic acid-binding Zn-ribbon protein
MNEGMENLKQIEELEAENLKLKKQVEMLQMACREAGPRIKKLEDQVESLTNPLNSMRKGGL